MKNILYRIYSKITKRYAVRVDKKYTTQYFPNGSVVRNPKIKEGDIIRGQRANMPVWYDDCYTNEEINKIIDEAIKPFVKGKDYE